MQGLLGRSIENIMEHHSVINCRFSIEESMKQMQVTIGDEQPNTGLLMENQKALKNNILDIRSGPMVELSDIHQRYGDSLAKA